MIVFLETCSPRSLKQGKVLGFSLGHGQDTVPKQRKEISHWTRQVIIPSQRTRPVVRAWFCSESGDVERGAHMLPQRRRRLISPGAVFIISLTAVQSRSIIITYVRTDRVSLLRRQAGLNREEEGRRSATWSLLQPQLSMSTQGVPNLTKRSQRDSVRQREMANNRTLPSEFLIPRFPLDLQK